MSLSLFFIFLQCQSQFQPYGRTFDFVIAQLTYHTPVSLSSLLFVIAVSDSVCFHGRCHCTWGFDTATKNDGNYPFDSYSVNELRLSVGHRPGIYVTWLPRCKDEAYFIMVSATVYNLSSTEPYLGNLVVAYRWSVVYSTEPWPNCMYWFPLPTQNYTLWYDL